MSMPKTTKLENHRQSIRALEEKRANILAELLNIRTMIRGAYARVMTKCGRKNCRCYEGEGHPHSRITWRENGSGFTRKVPSEEISWVQEMTEKHRQFRELRKELTKLESDVDNQLDSLADELVQQTREKKDFLSPITPVRKEVRP
jgi:hypothetical protein